MWITLLVMAVAVSLEPFRIGMAVLMLGRPQPARQLLALLGGGYAAGLAVGIVVLFGLRSVVADSPHVTLPRVQLVIGSMALCGAAAVGIHAVVRRNRPPTASPAVTEGPWRTRARRLMRGRSLWVAGMAGVGTGLPSVDYLAVLAVIIASGASAATQVTALVTFNLVAFALIELPLVAYLVAPDRTRNAMTRLNEWIRSRRQRDVAVLLATCGAVLVTAGLVGL